MKITFYKLEDWERSELETGLFAGHALRLATEPLTEKTLANIRAFLHDQPQNLVASR